MKVLVTGASGFVMSSLIERIVSVRPDWLVTACDLAPADVHVRRRLCDQDPRVQWERVDVAAADPATWAGALQGVDVVVHGAAISPSEQTEVRSASSYTDVNIVGAAQLLEATVHAPKAVRFINVSSVAVYGTPPAGSGPEPIAEGSPCHPVDLYDISKFTADAWTRRFRDVRGLDATSVRLTKTFGPLERPTGSRPLMSLPFGVAKAVASQRPLRISRRTLGAAADWLHAEDVAEAIIAVVTAPSTAPAYNVALGRRVPVADILDIARGNCPELAVHYADRGPGCVDLDPTSSSGKDGVFDTTLIRNSIGWKPQDFAARFDAYLTWARNNGDLFGDPGRISKTGASRSQSR